MTHTFTFDTPYTFDKTQSLHNILYIVQEETNKYFIQYIQYKDVKTAKNRDAIELSYVNVKVDRNYFLEIANICLDDRQRRRELFSTLGKRRFGANNNRHDYYLLNKKIDPKTLEKFYVEYNCDNPLNLCYSQATEYSTNQYRVHLQEIEGTYFAYLDQINITKRKKIHKNFCVELLNEDVEILNAIKNRKQRVDYIFNKIGKIYFKSLPKETLKLTKKYKNFQELALSRLIKNSTDMELSSRMSDNLLFRQLKEKRQLIDRIDLSLHKTTLQYISAYENQENRALFLQELESFIEHTQELKQLDEISKHLLTLKALSETQTLDYILSKNDNDLQDILLYALEVFTLWNQYLYNEDEDIKGFNAATIDLTASLRHLVDMCYKFQHEYRCHDAEVEKREKEKKKLENEKALETPLQNEKITSAEEFFEDIHIEQEIYDELRELENEIEELFYTDKYSQEINNKLIDFFEGYIHTLNPLFEFKDLSYSFSLLTKKLLEYELKDDGELIIVLLRALVSDLLEWKKSVLIRKTAPDIHYMDKSFYSNIAQIEISLENQDILEDDDSIEFF